MLKRLKKIPLYLKKLAFHPNKYETVKLALQVRPTYFLNALAALLDNRPIAVEMRNNFGQHDLGVFKQMIVHRKKRLRNHFYLWTHGQRHFCATHLQFAGIYTEYLSGLFEELYDYDWKDKNVLDVGGFIGDSALFFLENGAKHVVIYEPLQINVDAMRFNLASLQEKITIHQKAATEKNGPFILSSDDAIGSPGFGLKKGTNEILCEGIALKNILQQDSIDVAKIDCEGAEQFLIDISSDLIGTIPYWIIETHSLDLTKQIKEKFSHSGFSLNKEYSCTETIAILHFKKN